MNEAKFADRRILSFLPRRRDRRGATLVEIGIWVTLAAALLITVIVTVTQTATETKMNSYAQQATAILQRQIATRDVMGSTARIQQSTLVSLYSGLFAEYDEWSGATAVASTTAAGTTTTCGGQGIQFTPVTANLSADDAEIFRAALAQQIVSTIDEADFAAAIDNSDANTTSFSGSTGVGGYLAANLVKRNGQNTILCMGS